MRNSSSYIAIFITLTLVAIIGALKTDIFTRDTATSFIQYTTICIFSKILIDEIITDTNFIYTIINWFKIVLVISFVFLLLQFILGVEFSLAKTQNINLLSTNTIRYPSFFQDPQKYAQFLSAISFLMLIKEIKKRKYSIQNIVLFSLSIVCILLTGGRAALGGWAAGFLIIIILGKNKYTGILISIAAILTVVVFNYAEYFAMFQRESLNDSFDFRYAIWQDAFDIFKDNPYFGIGLGNYAQYVAIHNPDQYWIANNEITYFDHPESGYLKLLTEFGIIGFTAILSYIVLPIIGGYKKYLKNKEFYILLLIAALISWMIGFYTVYSFGDIRIRVLIITIICMLISTQNQNKDINEIGEYEIK